MSSSPNVTNTQLLVPHSFLLKCTGLLYKKCKIMYTNVDEVSDPYMYVIQGGGGVYRWQYVDN